MTASTYTGPGEVLFAPSFIGDLTTLRLTENDSWNVGKDAFIACTQGVNKELKNQGFSKAMFSGEGLFVYRVNGIGIMWIASFGAIIRKDVSSAQDSRRCCMLLTKCSYKTGRSTSSTMAISLHGIANTFLNEWQAEVSYLVSLLERAWSANLLAQERFSYKQEILRLLACIWRRMLEVKDKSLWRSC